MKCFNCCSFEIKINQYVLFNPHISVNKKIHFEKRLIKMDFLVIEYTVFIKYFDYFSES
jgi:hypothetical protein